MTNVKFQPWVGKSYHDGFEGVRTLVLGESLYQWDCDRDINTWPEVTKVLVQEQIDGEFTKAFWTNIVTAFINRKPSIDEKKSFWNSVAYYIYVQESAGDGARIRPADASWARSENAFKEVLESLKPEFILVLGYQLWDRLPDLGGYLGPAITGAPCEATWIYPLPDGAALAYGVKHPSSGFSGLGWHPHIISAIAIAKARL